MISKFKINDWSKAPIHYEKPSGIPDEIDFTPGINIIVGTNGSGKSTLLNTIKAY